MSARSDVEALIRKLRKTEGVEVSGRNGEGHYTIRKGDIAISVSSTPSDVRWKKNLEAELKRAGIVVGLRTPREVAQDRELFMLDHLMARKHTVAELTQLLRDAGEDISESGVRARLAKMEKRRLVFRANGASQGKEVEWRARSAVPEMPPQEKEEQGGATLYSLPGLVSAPGHAEVSTSIDLASAHAQLTITIDGPLDEILAKLAPLVRSDRAS